MPQQKNGRKKKPISKEEQETIKKIGLRLKEVRESLSDDSYYENQDYFAIDCGIKVGTLKAVETGRRILPLEDAIKIANKCNTNLDYLYCRSDIKNPNEEEFIPRLLQEEFVINVREKVFTSKDISISIPILDLSIKESLIQYFISVSDLKKQLKNKDIGIQTYESELKRLEEKYKKESLKDTEKQQVLIPRNSFKEEYVDPTALFSAYAEFLGIMYPESRSCAKRVIFRNKNKNKLSNEEIREELSKITNIK